jgi:hypothetical protein
MQLFMAGSHHHYSLFNAQPEQPLVSTGLQPVSVCRAQVIPLFRISLL